MEDTVQDMRFHLGHYYMRGLENKLHGLCTMIPEWKEVKTRSFDDIVRSTTAEHRKRTHVISDACFAVFKHAMDQNLWGSGDIHCPEPENASKSVFDFKKNISLNVSQLNVWSIGSQRLSAYINGTTDGTSIWSTLPISADDMGDQIKMNKTLYISTEKADFSKKAKSRLYNITIKKMKPVYKKIER